MKEVTDWHQLGLQLEVPAAKLKEIENDYPAKNQRCKTEMLTLWCQNTQVSWIKLAKAVGQIGHKVLEERLKKKG